MDNVLLISFLTDIMISPVRIKRRKNIITEETKKQPTTLQVIFNITPCYLPTRARSLTLVASTCNLPYWTTTRHPGIATPLPSVETPSRLGWVRAFLRGSHWEQIRIVGIWCQNIRTDGKWSWPVEVVQWRTRWHTFRYSNLVNPASFFKPADRAPYLFYKPAARGPAGARGAVRPPDLVGNGWPGLSPMREKNGLNGKNGNRMKKIWYLLGPIFPKKKAHPVGRRKP